jgi:hypothetical protein
LRVPLVGIEAQAERWALFKVLYAARGSPVSTGFLVEEEETFAGIRGNGRDATGHVRQAGGDSRLKLRRRGCSGVGGK